MHNNMCIDKVNDKEQQPMQENNTHFDKGTIEIEKADKEDITATVKQLNDSLTKGQQKLLYKIIDNPKLFDRNDNCIQCSIRELASKLGYKNQNSISPLLKILREHHLLKDVVDIFGVRRLMMSPSYIKPVHREEYLFMRAMFLLGSDEEARKVTSLYRNSGFIFHPITGEIEGKYNYVLMDNYLNRYSSTDRTKHRGGRVGTKHREEEREELQQNDIYYSSVLEKGTYKKAVLSNKVMDKIVGEALEAIEESLHG